MPLLGVRWRGVNGRPGRWACGTVGITVRVLPSDRRERYRREFETEMYDMSAGARFRFTCGVLSRAVSLRAALAETPVEDGMDEKITMWGRVRCALNQHDWVPQRTEDGEAYSVCTRCGRDDYQPPSGNGAVNGLTLGGSH